jgi:hypothetical protein
MIFSFKGVAMEGIVYCGKGHENRSGDSFCRTCGERISGGQGRCLHCSAKIDSAARFCGGCGKPVTGEQSLGVEGMIWRRGDNDFATRIEVDDLPGILKKGIIVEQGTKALLFINGALAETLMPGKYWVGGLADKLKHLESSRKATVVLTDVGDVETSFTLAGIYTKDPLKIEVACKVVIQMENPSFFFTNVLKGRDHYAISELRSSLYDELSGAFNEVVGKKSVSELNWDLSLKRQFEVFVENHLRTTLQRMGLSLIQLRTMDYRFEGYDKIRQMREEIYLLVTEEEAKLQRRKRLFDVYDQTQIQDIAEETKEVRYREQRQDLWAQMRKLANSDKMDEVRSADDLEAFVHDVDKGKLLRDEEIKDLKQGFAESGLRRDFLLRKIDLEQRIDEERISLVGHAENDLAAWEAKKARLELDEQLRAQKDIKGTEREIKVDDATADAKIADLKREQERKEMEDGLAALRAVKETKLFEKREEMNIVVTRLERLSQLGIEALISASGADQARMLKDLKQTEILKGMTEEQILAMGAKDSPELAKAFQEKFKGMSAAEQEKLYREMMAQKDNQIKVMQEMYNKGLETQRDATVGVAQGGRINAVYPPPGQPGFYTAPGQGGYYPPPGPGGTGGAEVVVCQKCRSKVATGQKFCNNCGSEMF